MKDQLKKLNELSASLNMDWFYSINIFLDGDITLQGESHPAKVQWVNDSGYKINEKRTKSSTYPTYEKEGISIVLVNK